VKDGARYRGRHFRATHVKRRGRTGGLRPRVAGERGLRVER
jgi:hypothetical protein